MAASETGATPAGACDLLAGVRVLDLSRVLAGPWATQTLADYGAEVIKIERPGQGDDTRGWGPPWSTPAQEDQPRDSAYYLCANRGKRSVAVDIASPEGAERMREWARSADVLVENYKVGQLARYGLDYDSLKAINPGLVYCAITGYGQTGPDAQRPGYDFAIQAAGGLMSITGEPGREPQKVGVAVVDLMTGTYATGAILAALLRRQRTGQGAYIDCALLDVQIAMLANQASNHLIGGTVPTRLGNAHPNIVPYQALATQDGHMVVAVGNDSQFRAFAAQLGLAHLADDPHYARNADRVAHREALIPLLQAPLLARTTADWVMRLDAAGVPCSPIHDVQQALAQPQVQARGLVVERVKHGTTLRLVGHPVVIDGQRPAAALPPPDLGEAQGVLN
ncbi:CaiB/BaiF CoA transferase family protein [Amphibiibacter pelophylacis]|uniref:CoA transferase n=1 Tax=Amphibiibacter pelophylacis TaxID=1799477 RepID=A0ACC6P406_9BURK